MSDTSKKACLIYVSATADRVPGARSLLEQQGYKVCEVEAGLPLDPTDASSFSQAVVDCIAAAELCVFLLPEDASDDGSLGGAAGVAEANEKRIIGVYCGQRTEFPQSIDEHAESVIRAEGPNLAEAISGTAIWEKPNGERAPDREIVRVRCQ